MTGLKWHSVIGFDAEEDLISEPLYSIDSEHSTIDDWVIIKINSTIGKFPNLSEKIYQFIFEESLLTN